MAISIQTAVRMQDLFSRPLMSIQAATRNATRSLSEFSATSQAAKGANLEGMSRSITNIGIAIQNLEEKKRRMSLWDTSGITQCNREINALRESMGKAQSAQGEVNSAIRAGNADRIRESYERFNREVTRTESIVVQNTSAQNEFNSAVSNGGGAFGGILSKLKSVAAAYLSIYGAKKMAGFAKDSISAANVQIQAETKLQTVMRQRMGATNDVVDSIKRMASAQQEIGVVGDEVQIAGIQQLATFMNNTDALETLIPAMNNLAVQQNGVNITGENMAGISNMMGKAMQGQTSALSRVGITFSEAEEKALKFGSEQERAAALAQIITNNVGNMNEAIANTPEGAMQQLANTWGDMKEEVGMQLYPAVINLVKVITQNLPVVKSIFSGIGAAVSVVVTIFAGIINIAGKAGNVMTKIGGSIKENWETIAPIATGVAVTIGVLAGAFALYQIAIGISTIATTIFSAALWTCPLTWIVIAIIAVIAAIYIAVGAFNKIAGTSVSATGIILGAIMTVGAFIYNQFLAIVDIVEGVIEFLVNGWVTFANFFGNVFNDPIASVIHLFGDLGDSVLGVIEKIASAIDKVFGSDLASAVSGWRSSLAGLTEYAAKEYGNGEYQKLYEELDIDKTLDGLGIKPNRIEYNSAFGKGVELGEGLDNKVKGFWDNTKDLVNLTDSGNNNNYEGFENLDESLGENKNIDEVGKVKDVGGSVNIAQEDIKALRELATMEYMQNVNQNTIAPVINVQVAEVKETADIDKVIEHFTIKVKESLNAAAEGVY